MTNQKYLDRMTKQELKELVDKYHNDLVELKSQNNELRKSLEKQEESQRRYIGLYDSAPVGFFILDENGLISTVNRTGAAMLSAEKLNLTGASFNSFVLPADRENFERHFYNVVRGNGPYQCELRIQKEDSSFIYVQLGSIAIPDITGNISEIRTTVHDITKHKLTEEKLQRNRAILRAIIDATDVMLVYLDPDFNFVWVNPAYANSCNMKPEELAGKNHFELFPHSENELIFRRVRDSGKSVFFKDKPFEFPDQPERGITYWDWSLVPHKDETDKLTGLVYSLRETTEFKRAQLELAESEDRFRRITETSTDIIFQMDLDGSITYCSPAIESFGYNPRKVIGHSFKEFVAEEELPKAIKAVTSVNKGESVKYLEIKIRMAEGTYADCEISATPVKRGGKVTGLQGVARNVTERKHVEMTLRKNEAQLRTVFENMNEGLVIADLEGKLIQWNPAAIEIHGFHSEKEYLRELKDFRDIFELSTETDGVLVFEQWPVNRILRGITLEGWEVNVRRIDIDWQRTFSYSGTLARNSEGQPLLAILTISDISERKWVEKQLIRAKNEWEQTFDSVPDLIAILDDQHQIIRANRAMAERMNLTPDQCVRQRCFSCVHGGNEPMQNCPHTLTMQDGREHRAEIFEEKLGGYFLVSTTPLRDERGSVFATVHVARDITERKISEEKIKLLNLELQKSVSLLEETNKELARSNWDLEQFVNIASHDLQEPLRTISSFVQLLKRRYHGKLDDKADTFIDFVVEGANQMQRLINDLLSFSRVGGGELAIKPIALQSVFDRVLKNLKIAIEENQAEIVIDSLPIVRGDDAQITLLFQNLLSNAIKFKGEAPPRIHVFSEQLGNEIKLCVRDNGIGIEQQYADQVFLIFQRLHRREEYSGTGIGLAICKKIVERHGGRIWVESESGLGATFCFTLPVN